jgi:type IV secretory pathway TrbD component
MEEVAEAMALKATTPRATTPRGLTPRGKKILMVAARTIRTSRRSGKKTIVTGGDAMTMTVIDGLLMTTVIVKIDAETMTTIGTRISAVKIGTGMMTGTKTDAEMTTIGTRIDVATTAMTTIATRIGVGRTIAIATRIDVGMTTTTATRTGGGSKTGTAIKIDVEIDAIIAMMTTETRVEEGASRK